MVRSRLKTFFLLLAAPFIFVAPTRAQQSDSGARSSDNSGGAITGRVVNSAGEPLTGASVSAGSISGIGRRKSATVESNGEFKISGLEPGLYSISASMPGYVYTSSPTSTNSQNYYRVGDSVTLTLPRGGVITGMVVGPNGPVVGVGVFATRVRDADGKKLATAFPGFSERRTDDRGVFRLYGLAPGAYILSAARPRTGLVAPGAYDNDVPTFYPSGTRDTASEIILREGDEITADIQYRAEPGHAVSGKLSGMVASDRQFSSSAQISITDVRDRTQIANTGTSFTDPSSFALFGIPDGEYELSALQYLATGDQLRSPPRRVTVHGTDITGISLTLAPLALIEGRLVFENDPKAGCAKRRETAAQETLVYARRYEPEKNPGAEPKVVAPEVPLSAASYTTQGVGDAKGSFTLRNLPPGSYRIDPRPPASGWYVRSIVIGTAQSAAARTASVTTARDGISVRSGEKLSGLVVTITEGAAKLRGRISLVEGRTLLPAVRVFLVPAERESAENVLRFYEARPEGTGAFVVDNVAPGKYWMVARPMEENDVGVAKSIRQDGAFRAKVVRDAEALKKDLTFKPCEQVADYELPYASSSTP